MANYIAVHGQLVLAPPHSGFSAIGKSTFVAGGSTNYSNVHPTIRAQRSPSARQLGHHHRHAKGGLTISDDASPRDSLVLEIGIKYNMPNVPVTTFKNVTSKPLPTKHWLHLPFA